MDMDLIVTLEGDSIACQIDSVTETKVFLSFKRQNKWCNSYVLKENIVNYEFKTIYKRYASFKEGTTIIKKYREKKPVRTWAGIGFGANHLESPCIGIDINHQIKSNLFSLRYISSNREGLIILSSAPPLYLHDFGFLYGVCTKAKKLNISASIGVGLVAYNDRIRLITEKIYYINKIQFSRRVYQYETTNHFTIGLPMELQLLYFCGKIGGIGLKTFANINKEQSIMGVALVVPLGRLRWY